MIAWFKALPGFVKIVLIVVAVALASGITYGGMFGDGFSTNGPGTGPAGYGMPAVPGAAAAGDPSAAPCTRPRRPRSSSGVPRRAP